MGFKEDLKIMVLATIGVLKVKVECVTRERPP